MRRLLENYHILPPTIAASLIVEYGRVTGSEQVPKEREQVELLSWLLDTPELGSQPVVEHGGGVRLRPKKLDPPPGAIQDLDEEADDEVLSPEADVFDSDHDEYDDEEDTPLIVATRWGGVRVAPHRLQRPEDVDKPPQSAKPSPLPALSPASARVDTIRALLTTPDPPLDEKPIAPRGGGCRLVPPRLMPLVPPPPAEALAPEIDELLAPLEDAPIDPIGAQGLVSPGGGARLPPPRLLPLALPAAAMEIVEESEMQYAAPTGPAFVGNRELFLEAVSESCEPLEALDKPLEAVPLAPGPTGGFGIKVAPPRLHPFVPPPPPEILGGPSEDGEPEPLTELEEAPLMRDGGGARLPPPRLAVVAGVGTPWHLRSEEEQARALEEPEVVALEDQYSAVPPADEAPLLLAATVEEIVEPEVPLESKPVMSGFTGGYGIRILPPKLLPFMPPAPPEVLASEEETDPKPLAPIEERPVDRFDSGGGIRCPPPRLLPVATPAAVREAEQEVAAAVAAEGHVEASATPFSPINSARRELFIVPVDAVLDAGRFSVRVKPPHLLPFVPPQPPETLEEQNDEVDGTVASVRSTFTGNRELFLTLPTPLGELSSAPVEPAGGGARLHPPHLLPLASSSAPWRAAELLEEQTTPTLGNHAQIRDETVEVEEQFSALPRVETSRPQLLAAMVEDVIEPELPTMTSSIDESEIEGLDEPLVTTRFGTRVAPPKLLPFIEPVPPSLFGGSGGDGGGDDDEEEEMPEPLAPLEEKATVRAGGGARLPPPRLLSVATRDAVRKEEMLAATEVMHALACVSPSGPANQVRRELFVSKPDAAAELAQLSTVDAPLVHAPLRAGAAGGFGIRLAPPSLMPLAPPPPPDILGASVEEDDAPEPLTTLEEASTTPSGGGVRVVVPQLVPLASSRAPWRAAEMPPETDAGRRRMAAGAPLEEVIAVDDQYSAPPASQAAAPRLLTATSGRIETASPSRRDPQQVFLPPVLSTPVQRDTWAELHQLEAERSHLLSEAADLRAKVAEIEAVSRLRSALDAAPGAQILTQVDPPLHEAALLPHGGGVRVIVPPLMPFLSETAAEVLGVAAADDALAPIEAAPLAGRDEVGGGARVCPPPLRSVAVIGPLPTYPDEAAEEVESERYYFPPVTSALPGDEDVGDPAMIVALESQYLAAMVAPEEVGAAQLARAIELMEQEEREEKHSVEAPLESGHTGVRVAPPQLKVLGKQSGWGGPRAEEDEDPFATHRTGAGGGARHNSAALVAADDSLPEFQPAAPLTPIETSDNSACVRVPPPPLISMRPVGADSPTSYAGEVAAPTTYIQSSAASTSAASAEAGVFRKAGTVEAVDAIHALEAERVKLLAEAAELKELAAKIEDEEQEISFEIAMFGPDDDEEQLQRAGERQAWETAVETGEHIEGFLLSQEPPPSEALGTIRAGWDGGGGTRLVPLQLPIIPASHQKELTYVNEPKDASTASRLPPNLSPHVGDEGLASSSYSADIGSSSSLDMPLLPAAGHTDDDERNDDGCSSSEDDDHELASSSQQANHEHRKQRRAFFASSTVFGGLRSAARRWSGRGRNKAREGGERSGDGTSLHGDVQERSKGHSRRTAAATQLKDAVTADKPIEEGYLGGGGVRVLAMQLTDLSDQRSPAPQSGFGNEPALEDMRRRASLKTSEEMARARRWREAREESAAKALHPTAPPRSPPSAAPPPASHAASTPPPSIPPSPPMSNVTSDDDEELAVRLADATAAIRSPPLLLRSSSDSPLSPQQTVSSPSMYAGDGGAMVVYQHPPPSQMLPPPSPPLSPPSFAWSPILRQESTSGSLGVDALLRSVVADNELTDRLALSSGTTVDMPVALRLSLMMEYRRRSGEWQAVDDQVYVAMLGFASELKARYAAAVRREGSWGMLLGLTKRPKLQAILAFQKMGGRLPADAATQAASRVSHTDNDSHVPALTSSANVPAAAPSSGEDASSLDRAAVWAKLEVCVDGIGSDAPVLEPLLREQTRVRQRELVDERRAATREEHDGIIISWLPPMKKSLRSGAAKVGAERSSDEQANLVEKQAGKQAQEESKKEAGKIEKRQTAAGKRPWGRKIAPAFSPTRGKKDEATPLLTGQTAPATDAPLNLPSVPVSWPAVPTTSVTGANPLRSGLRRPSSRHMARVAPEAPAGALMPQAETGSAAPADLSSGLRGRSSSRVAPAMSAVP